MSKIFKIYADNEEIYIGDFGEVPEYYRGNLIEALVDWGDCLSKGGLNELLYSSFHWYRNKNNYCENCEEFITEENYCDVCKTKSTEKFIFNRDDRIEKILTCIGMINRVEIENI
ncbi:MAG: hypothetical protein GTO02_17970 [Candidatus Dadabacteria bacterium]|nr:hypothetical protein [Candidatus Dadabacteria bacterium]NIQ16202.1 hypothetical protein [Candidatus Dadabacteria bacterium]